MKLSYPFLVGRNYTVNTQVLSSEVRGAQISHLTSPITLTFKALNTSMFSHDKLCAFWDTSNKG